MKDVIPIHEAKTNLSKLVKRAASGETIYIGSYGQPQAVISPLPVKKPIKIGVYDDEFIPNAYDDDDLIGSDPEIVQMFEDSINRPFPS